MVRVKSGGGARAAREAMTATYIRKRNGGNALRNRSDDDHEIEYRGKQKAALAAT